MKGVMASQTVEVMTLKQLQRRDVLTEVRHQTENVNLNLLYTRNYKHRRYVLQMYILVKLERAKCPPSHEHDIVGKWLNK